MSEYRDDTQETAVAGDSTWVRLRALVEDSALAAAALVVGLAVLHADTATAADQVTDFALQVAADTAQAHDAAPGILRAAVVVADAARASDGAALRLREQLTDAATARDAAISKLSAQVGDSAGAGETVQAVLHARDTLASAAAATDFSGQFAADRPADAAQAGESVADRLAGRNQVAESATVSDEVAEVIRTRGQPLEEVARAEDATTGALHARNLLQDVALADDEAIDGGVQGQAWTANTTTWAMSRYAPYTFTSLAVIDGVLHGVAEDGVYALDGGAAPVDGRITTGMLDVGRGGLVHPIQALTSLELDGAAEMAVTTTQAGYPQTYTYPLARATPSSLGSGRFVFGRGLRGRHFAFELRVSGLNAYINELSVTATQTKRRV